MPKMSRFLLIDMPLQYIDGHRRPRFPTAPGLEGLHRKRIHNPSIHIGMPVKLDGAIELWNRTGCANRRSDRSGVENTLGAGRQVRGDNRAGNRKVLKAKIADAVQDKADQIASWPEADKLGDVARFRDRAAFFRSAPALIAVAAAQYKSAVDLVLTARETDPQAAQIHEWRNMANSRIQSVASAITYLLLIFHQMGLGAVWMTGPMQAKEDIEKILKVPPEMDIVALIPVGYPDESPTSTRRPVGEVTEIIR